MARAFFHFKCSRSAMEPIKMNGYTMAYAMDTDIYRLVIANVSQDVHVYV